MRKWELSRRTFLRGAGTLMALPVLDAMLPSLARAQTVAQKPRRLFFFFVPNGIHMQSFVPAQTGTNFTLPPILAPLERVKPWLTVLSGLDNPAARPDVIGDHASGTGSFLTCTHVLKTAGANIRNAISVDQVAAQALKSQTRFASLELGTSGGGATGDCDSGYSCAYVRNISWAGPSTPMAKEVNPVSVFDRLFGGADAGQSLSAINRRRLYRKSVLDFVSDEAKRLEAKVGSADKKKLDEYFTGVREIELRLEKETPASCQPGSAPAAPVDLPSRTRLMLDLAVLAFQCDQTRVVSFMLENGLSYFVFSFLGLDTAHHSYSHHQNNPANFAALTRINTWEVEQYAYLLEKMNAVQEPDGTLLDNSLVFFSSEVGDGNTHTHFDLPVVVAGKGGGRVAGGRHLSFTTGEPLANLYLSMLRTVGVADPRFADSTGELRGFLS